MRPRRWWRGRSTARPARHPDHNAGTSGTSAPIDFKDLDKMSEAFWGNILSTNLLGRSAAPAPRRRRSRSRAAPSSTPPRSPGSARSQQRRLRREQGRPRQPHENLARALAPEVRVNAVAPGLVDSPWTKTWPDERKRNHVAQTLIPRMVTPEDIAEAMLFLAAGGAMVTGHTLVVDGGMSW